MERDATPGAKRATCANPAGRRREGAGRADGAETASTARRRDHGPGVDTAGSDGKKGRWGVAPRSRRAGDGRVQAKMCEPAHSRRELPCAGSAHYTGVFLLNPVNSSVRSSLPRSLVSLSLSGRSSGTGCSVPQHPGLAAPGHALFPWQVSRPVNMYHRTCVCLFLWLLYRSLLQHKDQHALGLKILLQRKPITF